MRTSTPKQILDKAKAEGRIRYWWAAENGYYVRFIDNSGRILTARQVQEEFSTIPPPQTAKKGRK